jgi:Zn-dependent protease with chaperone function
MRPARPARSVRPDRTAWCSLALTAAFALPAGLCLLPLALLARHALGLPLSAAYGAWLAGSLCYTVRPVQLGMARLLWPMRKPTAAEARRLAPVWSRVVDRAGVAGDRFRIRVVDLPEVNAHSVGRDVICVTVGALDQLGDRELAGVLAHELGHHLRMHTSAAAFLVWVLLPLQGVALIGAALAYPLAIAAYSLEDCGADMAVLPARCLKGTAGALRIVFAGPGLLAFAAKNAAGRVAEYRVDAFAVEVGLGAELLSALRWFAAGEAAEAAARPRTRVSASERGRGRARHAAVRMPRPTHPPLDRRMARIAARTAVKTAVPEPDTGKCPIPGLR